MTILSFSSKILSRSAQWGSCFSFTLPCEREAGLNINKVCDFVMNEKNNIFISCVFNGFKYRNLSGLITRFEREREREREMIFCYIVLVMGFLKIFFLFSSWCLK